MKFDLIIDSRSSEVVIALLRDGQLIELHKQKEVREPRAPIIIIIILYIYIYIYDC